MPIIDLSHLEHRYIPATKGNRDLPEGQRLVVYIRGVGMRESQGYLRGVREAVEDQEGAVTRVHAAIDAGQLPDVADEAAILDAAERLERLHLSPVVRIVLGDQQVDDIDSIWSTLDQDSELKGEIIAECQRALGVLGGDEAPLSGSDSTGG